MKCLMAYGSNSVYALVDLHCISQREDTPQGRHAQQPLAAPFDGIQEGL